MRYLWTARYIFAAKAVVDGPFFEIEKDCIEAEKDKAYASGEPVERRVCKSVRINPNLKSTPLLGFPKDVLWVWIAEEERGKCSEADDTCHTSYCVVEAELKNKESSHQGINEAGCHVLATCNGAQPRSTNQLRHQTRQCQWQSLSF